MAPALVAFEREVMKDDLQSGEQAPIVVMSRSALSERVGKHGDDQPLGRYALLLICDDNVVSDDRLENGSE